MNERDAIKRVLEAAIENPYDQNSLEAAQACQIVQDVLEADAVDHGRFYRQVIAVLRKHTA